MNNNQPLNLISIENKNIEECIYNIRGQQVMLDSDIAFFFEVETKTINKLFLVLVSSMMHMNTFHQSFKE